jgi:hypothetical protein
VRCQEADERAPATASHLEFRAIFRHFTSCDLLQGRQAGTKSRQFHVRQALLQELQYPDLLSEKAKEEGGANHKRLRAPLRRPAALPAVSVQDVWEDLPV